MRPIPLKLRRKLDELPRMHQCALWGRGYGDCHGKIEWHHPWVYGGPQINEEWAIVGACHKHHDLVKQDVTVRDAFEALSLSMATAEDLVKYPRKDWDQIYQSLADAREKLAHRARGFSLADVCPEYARILYT